MKDLWKRSFFTLVLIFLKWFEDLGSIDLEFLLFIVFS